MCNLSWEKVQLLFECGFYTRLFGTCIQWRQRTNFTAPGCTAWPSEIEAGVTDRTDQTGSTPRVKLAIRCSQTCIKWRQSINFTVPSCTHKHNPLPSFCTNIVLLYGAQLDFCATVRSDAEERVAEERPAWKHKNVPAWTKNIMCFWDFGRLPSAM